MLAFVHQLLPLRSTSTRLNSPNLSKPQYPWTQRRTLYPHVFTSRRTLMCTVASSDETRKSDTRRQSPSSPSVEKLFQKGISIVQLKGKKMHVFRAGRPTTVYSGAIARCVRPADAIGDIENGAIVAVVDDGLQPLGLGTYNGGSMFRVRLVDWRVSVDEIEEWTIGHAVEKRLREARALRRILGLPSEDTDSYRLVNGDGDHLSGLFVDRFADLVVVQSCAAWCETHRKAVLQAVQTVVQEDGVTRVVWRTNTDRLRQDGMVHEDADVSAGEDGEVDEVLGRENGVVYGLSVRQLMQGQKTGHYADQRENRRFVADLVQGMARVQDHVRVLDLFCYTGGFGVAIAKRAENVRVTGVDTSEAAIQLARRNAELNGVSERMEFVQGDAQRQGLDEDHGGFDMVIVDPPKYAPRAGVLNKAVGKYGRVNAAAVRAVRPGGVLVSCSCSAAVAGRKGLLVEIVRDAAQREGREVTVVKTMGAAGDHPVHSGMLETEYLTVGVFVVH